MPKYSATCHGCRHHALQHALIARFDSLGRVSEPFWLSSDHGCRASEVYVRKDAPNGVNGSAGVRVGANLAACEAAYKRISEFFMSIWVDDDQD